MLNQLPTTARTSYSIARNHCKYTSSMYIEEYVSHTNAPTNIVKRLSLLGKAASLKDTKPRNLFKTPRKTLREYPRRTLRTGSMTSHQATKTKTKTKTANLGTSYI